MKKRWFVVILTIGLLLCVMPLSALALSSDPITDSDGNIIGWEDLSTDPYSFDLSEEQTPVVSQEQTPVVVAPAPHAASGPAETDPVKGAAAAYRSSTNGVAEDAAVHDPNADDESVPDLYEDPTDSATGTGSDQDVCAIGDQTYKTLPEAIDAAQAGDRIDLLQNITWDAGLEFHSKKNLTISGGGTHTLTLERYGIFAAEYSDITFKDLTLNIYAYMNPSDSGGTANLISNSNLRLNNVNMTLRPDANCGSSMYLYKESNLYLDGSHVTVEAVSGNIVDGIFADISDYATGSNRKVELNSSSLEVTGCSYTGLMLDHVDITLSSSDVVLTGNGLLDEGGGYGLACYNGKLAMLSSTLKATGNTSSWFGCGVFVYDLDVDGDSTLIASDNGVGGLGVGGEGYIHSGAKVVCDGNGEYDPGGAGGLSLFFS